MSDVGDMVPTGTACRRLGVHSDTLKNWHRAGKIRGERTAAGRWQWDVASYLQGLTRTGPALAAAGGAPMPEKKYAYTIKELTELGYGCRATLYGALAKGELKAVKRGRRTLVLVADLESWRNSWGEYRPGVVSVPKSKGRAKRKCGGIAELRRGQIAKDQAAA